MGPYLWYQFMILGRVAKMFPRKGFYSRYNVLYRERKHKKFRGNMWMEARYRDELNLFDRFWTNGPVGHYPEEYFSLPAYHPKYTTTAHKRKAHKLTNTYQIRRNLKKHQD